MTIEESIPEYSESYLLGQDVFYRQFNDLNFYIEDQDQENLYFMILRNLFSNVRVSKIFPLNGKTNVKNEAFNNIGDKTKIYIVDKDFDDLHGIIRTDIKNLFYLDKYCIENYFLSKEALVEYVIEEKPTLKRADIELYDFDELVGKKEEELLELFSIFFLVQKERLNLENTSSSIGKFTFNRKQYKISQEKIESYINDIKLLINDDERFNKFIEDYHIIVDNWRTQNIVSNNIGGKHLLPLVIGEIKEVFSLSKMPDHNSICYRLAKNSLFENLNFLQQRVNLYLSGGD